MSTAAGLSWRAAGRVLAVRLDNLGDVLMTTPALRALRQAPHRHLTLLTSSAGAALAPHLPDVDTVMVCDVPWQKGGAPLQPAAAEAAEGSACAPRLLADRLAARAFDAAVIFTTHTQSALPAALTCTLAGIPLRLAHCRENPYALLSDWVPECDTVDTVRHEVRRQLDLVAHVGAATSDLRLSFQVRPQDRAELRGVLDRFLDRFQVPFQVPSLVRMPLRGRPLVVMHPGASAASRRYPARRYSVVAAQLVAAGCALIVTGTTSESVLGAQVAGSAAGITDLTGRLSLGAFGALLERADLLIANNSGPVHVAAALGTPVVDLYALTNPQHTPWGVAARVLNHDVPCRNCYRSVCPAGHHACLEGVAPGQVTAAALELLAAAAPRVA